MNCGTEAEKKRILIDVRGKKIDFLADKTILNVCEDIKAEAKRKLERIKNPESCKDTDVLADVEKFLKESICKLMGDDIISRCGNGDAMNVPEYTEILCNGISKIGETFVSDFGKGCEESDG